MSNPYGGAQTAEVYVKFRPSYTTDLAKCVVDFCKSSQKGADGGAKLDLMVDVGCGSGQSSTIFQPYFEKIIASDISKEQLQQGKLHNAHENIEFKDGSEKQIPAKDSSVDLVISGAAAHWFDLDKFFLEVKRVLKPTGCLAIFGYWTPKISPLSCADAESSKIVSNLFEQAILESVSDEPTKAKAYLHLKKRYDDIFHAIPFTDKTKIDEFHLVYDCSINNLIGYMKSSDSYEPYIERKIDSLKKKKQKITKEIIDSVDYVAKFISRLKSSFKISNCSDSENVMTLDFNFFLILAKPE